MPTPFDNVDPFEQAATHATRTELELKALDARRTILLAQKAQEDALKAQVSEKVRTLAIELHKQLCPNDHPSYACTWYVEGTNPDDPNAAEWTGAAHQRWIGIAAGGVMVMRAIGWSVTEPLDG